MVDEMEKAGHRPHLANPTEAKKRMGKTNKTDALDSFLMLHEPCPQPHSLKGLRSEPEIIPTPSILLIAVDVTNHLLIRPEFQHRLRIHRFVGDKEAGCWPSQDSRNCNA
jgi:hypothetical protein